MIAVRLSRHSHEKLDGLKEFTVCIPKAGTMAKELAFAGMKSGRDFDKIKELSLETAPGEKVSVPVLSDCTRLTSIPNLGTVTTEMVTGILCILERSSAATEWTDDKRAQMPQFLTVAFFMSALQELIHR